MATGKQELGFFQKAALWAARKAFSTSLADSVGMSQVVSALSGGTTITGRIVTPDSAMRAAAVWGCVRVLSETVGSLPVAIYQMDSGGNPRKIDHPVGEVLAGSPNADMTSQEVIEAMMVNLALTGNAYAIVDRGPTGRLISITPLVSSNVSPERIRGTGEIVYKVTDLDGKMTTYPSRSIWHVKGFGSNGLIGFSPVGMARQAIGVAMDCEDFGAQFFRDGASAAGILTVDNWLKADQRAVAEEIINKKWAGLKGAHKIQLLEGGMKYQSVTMPLEDAQFLETRKFQNSEICRIYRVPPHMIADLERATFSNIEQQALEFVQFAILPYLTRFEQSAQRALFQPADRGRVFAKWNADGLLRADSTARSQLYSTLLQNGVINRNEARAKENLPYVDEDEMNSYTVQQNMALIQALGSLTGGDTQRG